MILLLNFAILGSEKSFYVAAKRMKYLIDYKKEENNEEDRDEEEEKEESNDDISLIMALFPFPFDSYDVIQLFRTECDQTGLFASLPEKLQAEIIELIK